MDSYFLGKKKTLGGHLLRSKETTILQSEKLKLPHRQEQSLPFFSNHLIFFYHLLVIAETKITDFKFIPNM